MQILDSTSSARKAPTEHVPILISGGGPVGLLTSILLSRAGIKNLVVEKRDHINTMPRARGITVRSVEIMGQLGLQKLFEAISLPPLWMKSFVYTETLAGEVLGVMHAKAMDPDAQDNGYSPQKYVVAAQDRIDPLLFEAVSGYSEAEIRFNNEVTGYVEDATGITTTVRKPNGTISRIRSEYLIAADGGKSLLRGRSGIGESGLKNLRSFINNHIRADFSRFTAGREGALIWTFAPGLEGLFQALDGKKNWAVQVQYDPETFEGDTWTEEQACAHIRAMIGSPAADDIEIEIVKTYTFTLSMMISNTLRKGRLLLTGDAAHQVPPHGGFGLNTGLQSAHNLAWKLAMVLRGEAPDALLDTYDSERREVAQRVCDFGKRNAGYIEQMLSAMRNASSTEDKSAIIAASQQYGNWWGLDLGVHYEGDGAFIADDVPLPEVADPVIDFVPHAKPGYRAPHFWALQGPDRVSSIELCHSRFVLFAGPAGDAWVSAAGDDRLGLKSKIKAYRVAQDGDLIPERDFCSLYGIGRSGAVLVRPDGHVAFRAQDATGDPTVRLGVALDHVLRRTVADEAASSKVAVNG
jgi:putative polyketide hydroxylase